MGQPGAVRALDVILPSGEARHYRRRGLEKDTTGYGHRRPRRLVYRGRGDPRRSHHAELQLVRLRRRRRPFRVLREPGAGSGYRRLGRGEQGPRPDPADRGRCLRGARAIDEVAPQLIRPEARKLGIDVPEEAGAMLFLEQEQSGEADEVLEAWFDVLAAHPWPNRRRLGKSGSTAFVASVASPCASNLTRKLGPSEGGREKDLHGLGGSLHQLHRAVEDNEMARSVPTHRTVRYGHIGNGHPHFNLLARNGGELDEAKRVAEQMARMAVQRGGTAAAEHGLGKVKRNFLNWIHPPEVVALMRAMKGQMDPRGTFAPGNLFPDSSHSS